MSTPTKPTKKHGAKQILTKEFIYKIVLLEVVGFSLILPAQSSTGEITNPTTCLGTNNNCLDQIAFHTTVFGNSSASSTGVITTSSWTTFLNETMIVVPTLGATFFPAQVSTVKDTLGDTFTRQILQFYAVGSPDFNELEVWTGRTSTIGATNAVTVTWNTTQNQILLVQVSTYVGVSSIGIKTSVSGNGPVATNTITIKTIRSGVWIFGAISKGPTSPPCNQITTSPSFTRRIDGCAQNGSLGVETELSDNATAIRNAFSLAYAPTWTSDSFFEQAVLELVSLDSEPLNPDFTTFCTTTNGNCCTSSNGQCVGPVTVQILFLPVISARSITTFTAIMYATPIPYTPSSIVASFQWFAHNSTFAFTESGANQCTIAIGAFSCSVTTTFGTPFVGVPNVVATSTTPSKTLALP